VVLAASDELRHAYDQSFNWRESLYFNFADKTHGLGGWIYLWVVPNKKLKSGMLVSVYHGVVDRRDANDMALNSPGHRYVDPSGNWVYCFKKEVSPLIDANFDDVELCGLRLVRRQPLRLYAITFADDFGNHLDLTAEFPMRPYDYADGAYSTPSWVATNRYHRAWRVAGSLSIAGVQYPIRTTGDSDHSWGTRDMEVFSTHTFKMWSFQTRDGQRSVSVIEQGAGLYLGFVDIDGDTQSVQAIEHVARYTATGVQRDIEIVITDVAGRRVLARLPAMFSVIGHGEPAGLWGFEGVGCYQVDGWGECTGVASYFWPPTVTADALHRGEVNVR
jgi:hypothetical protein